MTRIATKSAGISTPALETHMGTKGSVTNVAGKDKKYYWLKFKGDFFKRHDIQIIEKMPNGKEIVLFYVKLLCESVDHEGSLRFSDKLPYDAAMLAAVTNTDEPIVEQALEILEQFHLIEIMDDGTYFMEKVPSMLGSESYWAKKKREQRATESEDIGQCPTDVQQSPTCPSKSKSIEKDIDKEKEKKSVRETTHTIFQKVLPEYPFSDVLTAKMGEWITYKMERKEPYKEQGMRSLLTQVGKHSVQYGDQAVCELIDECMANGWKGIIFDKLKKQAPIRQEVVPSWMNKPKKNSFHNFNQRQYDNDELEKMMLGTEASDEP